MPRPRLENDLPEVDEPLDGYDPVVPAGRRITQVPTNGEAVAIIEGTRRKLADLPVTPRHLNPIACICLYTLYGLDMQEIAVATGLGMDQIQAIRMSNEYALMQRAVVDTVLETETGEVKDFIKKAAGKAGQRIVSQIDSQNADVAYRAAKDVLDRSGLRPMDPHADRSGMSMGLVIEVVDKRGDKDRPVIDMEEG